MEQDDEINSSDFEFGDAPPNPFANAGKASIESMIKHAVRDRLASKKAVEQLTHVKSSKTAQHMYSLWYNRFQTFRENTLKVR
jgi:hypothetical protein